MYVLRNKQIELNWIYFKRFSRRDTPNE